ncbi:MAG: hypothetical protein OXB98_05565 [Bryobacterales bacterium]|nr:hypothetical protein [Bryobacterales bacterium]
MSFREKSAWISLISIAIVGFVFFLHVPRTLAPPPSPDIFDALLICLAGLVVIEVIAHAVVAIRAPLDAQAPKDERELMIELRAIRRAAYVYAPLSMGAVSLLHLGANGAALGYGVLLALVTAELVNYGSRVLDYRRER